MNPRLQCYEMLQFKRDFHLNASDAFANQPLSVGKHLTYQCSPGRPSPLAFEAPQECEKCG
jgi:hypothetical protein